MAGFQRHYAGNLQTSGYNSGGLQGSTYPDYFYGNQSNCLQSSAYSTPGNGSQFGVSNVPSSLHGGVTATSADVSTSHDAGLYGGSAAVQHGWQAANTTGQYQYPSETSQPGYSENQSYEPYQYSTGSSAPYQGTGSGSVAQLPSSQPGDDNLVGALASSSYSQLSNQITGYAAAPPLPHVPPPSAPPPPSHPPPSMPPSESNWSNTQSLQNLSEQSTPWGNALQSQPSSQSTEPSAVWSNYPPTHAAAQNIATISDPQPPPATSIAPSSTFPTYSSQHSPSVMYNTAAPSQLPSNQFGPAIASQNYVPAHSPYTTQDTYSSHVSGPYQSSVYIQAGYTAPSHHPPHMPLQHSTSIHSIPPHGPLSHSSHPAFSPPHNHPTGPHAVSSVPTSFSVGMVHARGATRLPEVPRTVTDISQLVKQPGRVKRANKIFFILRGLPGSGKSMIAKKIKELEVENGGTAPRIHSIDDYFLTEVEKEVADEEGTGRKGRKRKIIENEYSYDAKLEGTYQKQLLKAVARTLEEGRYKFVVVDACNVRMDDVKDYWNAAQRTGYEPYVLQPLTMDPELCYQRGVHDRSMEDIKMLWQQWEPTPPLYGELSMGSIYAPTPDQIEDVDMESDEEEDTSKATKAGLKISHSSRWEGDDDNKDAASTDKGSGKAARKKLKVVKSDAEFLNDLDVLLKPDKGKAGWISTDKDQVQSGDEAVGSGQAGSGEETVPKRKSARKSVRWADEVDDDETGFRIGPPRQLEQTLVLEGLGPPKDHPEEEDAPHGSFQEQVKREQAVFRSIMFGHGGLGSSS